jgi:hypothetical protein
MALSLRRTDQEFQSGHKMTATPALIGVAGALHKELRHQLRALLKIA